MSSSIKSASVIMAEGNTNHRSKADLKAREQAEKAVLTGHPIEEGEEVASDPVAHAEFVRLINLMDNIGKNDELFGSACRRYCLVTSRLHKINDTIKRLEELKAQDMNDSKMFMKVENAITSKERQAIALRGELTEFEKQNGMTISASLRMISKKPEKKRDPLLEILYPDGDYPEGVY